jgi:hypothetical protein
MPFTTIEFVEQLQQSYLYSWLNSKDKPADSVSKHWAYRQIWYILQLTIFYPGDAKDQNKEKNNFKSGQEWGMG